MTDAHASLDRIGVHRTAGAAGRLKARYAAESRFRIYGLLAVALAGVILVLLVANIVWNGRNAFFQNVVSLEIFFDPQMIDPSGRREPGALGAADYTSLVRAAMGETIPSAVETRSDRRLFLQLVTSGARFALRDRVVTDPSIIGQTRVVAFPVSDDADIYLKGDETGRTKFKTRGTAVPSGTTGAIDIVSSKDDFREVVQSAKDQLTDQVRLYDGRMARARETIVAFAGRLKTAEARLADAQGQGDQRRIEAVQEQIQDIANAIERERSEIGLLQAQRADAQSAIDSSGQAIDLSEAMRTFIVTINQGAVKITAAADDRIQGELLIPLISVAAAAPGAWSVEEIDVPASSRRISDKEIAWLDHLRGAGLIKSRFNVAFFTGGDSREPELAGIWGAVVGSFLTLSMTLVLSFPIGVAAAIYLEEFAPKNRLTDFIEVNINNLAAVPSIVFGLLGLAVFLNFFGLPRSAPLVGGMVLALMTLPTIIISSRAALKAVPPSIREAALGIGASKVQTITHHVLPLAMPGMLTGTIIGMAQALGETAPLIMIGMVAFIVDIPTSPLSPATALPVQIFIWADSPERAFMAKTAAAIIVLLGFLIFMNILAVLLRKRFERRW